MELLIKMNIKISKFDKNKDAILPKKASEGSAGFDLYAIDDIVIKPNSWKLVNTNVCIELPKGYEAQVRSRSGLALKEGIFVLNGIGTIDSDYRGSIGVILANFGIGFFSIEKGTRIAQLVINQLPDVEFETVNELEKTERDVGGFGSTGIN